MENLKQKTFAFLNLVFVTCDCFYTPYPELSTFQNNCEMKMLVLVTLCSFFGYTVYGSVNNCINRCDFMDGQCTQAIINPDGSCLTTSK